MASFIQFVFFFASQIFGIPASVGGNSRSLRVFLYSQMLGSVPDFHKGSVVAVMMLLPSIVSIALLRYLEKYNVRYQKISVMELPKKSWKRLAVRDWKRADHPRCVIHIRSHLYCAVCAGLAVSDWIFHGAFPGCISGCRFDGSIQKLAVCGTFDSCFRNTGRIWKCTDHRAGRYADCEYRTDGGRKS
mgnify:CR=1 FL=1